MLPRLLATRFSFGSTAASKAAFTPAQHVARQQVVRTSNMLPLVAGNKQLVTGNKRHVACCAQATCCAGVNAA